MTALNDYLEDFYRNPLLVEEYKINFLKNHFFPDINIFFNTNLKNFKIGVNKKKDYIFFKDMNNLSYEIIYNRVTKIYYKRIKIYDKYSIQLIDINDYKNKLDNSKNKLDNIKCINNCIIL